MKEGRKPENPDDELQKMPRTKAPKFKPQPKLAPAFWHCWQAGETDVLTGTPPVALIHYTDSDCYERKQKSFATLQ